MSENQTSKRIAAGLCTMCGTRKPPEYYHTCQNCRDRVKINNAERKQRLITAKICFVCGKRPATEGYKWCSVCATTSARLSKIRREHLKQSGICVACQITPATQGITMCLNCLAKRYSSHAAKRCQRLQSGLCADCNKPRVSYSRRFCADHWISYNNNVREAAFGGNRLAALQRDNFRCSLCQRDALTTRLHIHHRNNNPQDNRLENLITLCQHCHNAVTDLSLCPNPLKVIDFVKEQLTSLPRDEHLSLPPNLRNVH